MSVLIEHNLKDLLLYKINEDVFDSIQSELSENYDCVKNTKNIIELIKILETMEIDLQLEIIKSITIFLSDIEITCLYERYELIQKNSSSDGTNNLTIYQPSDENEKILKNFDDKPLPIQHQVPVVDLCDEFSQISIDLKNINFMRFNSENQLLPTLLRSSLSPSSSFGKTTNVYIKPVQRERIYSCLTGQLGSSWKKMANCLNLKQYQINQIEAIYKNNHPKSIEKVLNIYFNNANPDCIDLQLCRCLVDIGRSDLKNIICDILK